MKRTRIELMTPLWVQSTILTLLMSMALFYQSYENEFTTKYCAKRPGICFRVGKPFTVILLPSPIHPFSRRYGTPTHVLPRKVITEGILGSKKVEAYFLKIFAFRMSATISAPFIRVLPVLEISKSATVEDLINRVAELSGLDRPNLRYWHLSNTALENRPLEGPFYPSDRMSQDHIQPFPRVGHAGKRLDEALVESDDAIVVEYRSWIVNIGSIQEAACAVLTTREKWHSIGQPFFLFLFFLFFRCLAF